MSSTVKTLYFQELTEENRTLSRLVKRQGVVLDRISSHQGELPTLLYAHNEEVRVMRQRMKQAQDISKQLEEKLRFRDAEIFRLKEHSKKQELNSVGSSRKQSRASSHFNLEMEDLKDMVAEKEHEISVSFGLFWSFLVSFGPLLSILVHFSPLHLVNFSRFLDHF